MKFVLLSEKECKISVTDSPPYLLLFFNLSKHSERYQWMLIQGEGGREEVREMLYFSNLPFTCTSQAAQYIEITLSTFIPLIPYLFSPLYLILLMARVEQWITVSKWAILSSCCYTESNYIKYLVLSARLMPPSTTFLSLSIFCPILLPSLPPSIYVLPYWLAYSFKSTQMLSSNDKL